MSGASYNRIVLLGRITSDPELSYLPSGMAISQMRLAVNERVKNNQTGEWSDRVCYVDVTAFDRQAENCNKYLHKGSQILVEGKLRYETWEAKDGSGKRSKHSVVADRVQFLSGREEGGAAAPGPSSSASVSVPPPAAPPPSALADTGDEDDSPPF